jgi:hypothetical protein
MRARAKITYKNTSFQFLLKFRKPKANTRRYFSTRFVLAPTHSSPRALHTGLRIWKFSWLSVYDETKVCVWFYPVIACLRFKALWLPHLKIRNSNPINNLTNYSFPSFWPNCSTQRYILSWTAPFLLRNDMKSMKYYRFLFLKTTRLSGKK